MGTFPVRAFIQILIGVYLFEGDSSNLSVVIFMVTFYFLIVRHDAFWTRLN